MARGRLILLLGFIAGSATCVNTSAAAAAPSVPAGFMLPASNGYSIHALAFEGGRFGKRDGLILFVGRGDGGATYFVRKVVTVTESTISASLGELGSIDLRFVPTGEVKTEASACDRDPLAFDSGFYEGKIDFEGEEGYTEAHSTRVRGEVRMAANLLCGSGVNEGSGGHAPGARLKTRRRWDRGSLEFEATKNSPSRPARFRVLVAEGRSGLVIEREVRAEAGPSAFEFDVPSQTALLEPPSPFGGSARWLRTDRRPGRLRG